MKAKRGARHLEGVTTDLMSTDSSREQSPGDVATGYLVGERQEGNKRGDAGKLSKRGNP
jgi:hypothetical protein